jgi:threonine/homoserine/homoserine lactone efflux protein
MSLNVYLAFVAACVALALLPGPNVTLVIANGLRHGTRAALINIAGAQLGLAIVISIVAVGLASLMATMGYWFDWVRLAGAIYLVWLGLRLIRAPGHAMDADAPPPAPPRGGFFLQGLLVLLSNPKALLFFGAFIPQFVDVEKDHFSQVVLLGITFMVNGDRRRHRRDLRAIGRAGAAVLFGAAHDTAVAGLRRLHDRRRGLAGAGPHALIGANYGNSFCARNAVSISPNIRASRSAHCAWPTPSVIRSWRISMPVFIRPRASP